MKLANFSGDSLKPEEEGLDSDENTEPNPFYDHFSEDAKHPEENLCRLGYLKGKKIVDVFG